MSERLLLRSGYVLSMDDEIGETVADMLVEDGVIGAMAPSLEVEDAEVLDVTGHVVMPGFVDTHRHTWQTPFRGVCADWTLDEYFRGIRATVSPNCSAGDVYAGNYVGALEALDAGVTTVLDFSHCNNSPEHADAALQGLRDNPDGRSCRLSRRASQRLQRRARTRRWPLRQARWSPSRHRLGCCA
jgi:cytosine/adenosine deaminase-related metal-dependent hydrolase